MNRYQIKNAVLIGLAAMFITSCSNNEEPGITERPKKERKDIVLSRGEQEMVDSHAKFAFDFFKELNSQKSGENKNMLVSPLSVTIDLSIFANAVDDESYGEFLELMNLAPGTTRAEMNDLCKKLVDELLVIDSQVDLKVANSIWTKPGYTVKEEFVDEVMAKYSAPVQAIDFCDKSSEKVINGWVNNATGGLIKEIHKADPDLSRFIISKLCNALYFNGEWCDKFNRDKTSNRIFKNIDGTISSVPMMKGRSEVYNVNDDNRSVVALPFGNGAYSMYFVIPDEGQDFNESIAALDLEKWTRYKKSFFKKSIEMIIPRFNIDYNVELMETLAEMGLKRCKEDETSLPYMFEADLYHVSVGVTQSCSIKLEENGVKSAAVTVITVGYSLAAPVKELVLDRPFMFLIEEQSTGAILFMGKVIKL